MRHAILLRYGDERARPHLAMHTMIRAGRKLEMVLGVADERARHCIRTSAFVCAHRS